MKNKIKNIIFAILILTVFSTIFVGCDVWDKHTHSYDWVTDIEPTYTSSGIKHKECACGDKVEKNTEIPEKQVEGGVVLKDELVEALTKYLEDYRVSYDIPGHTFGDKITYLKTVGSSFIVKYGNECYYAAAYYSPTHDLEDERFDYCCCDEYIWIGFEQAENIKETLDGLELVATFQVNPPELCKNLKTDSTDVVMEHFMLVNPVFSDGIATIPEKSFDDFFIYIKIDYKSEKYLYHTSKVAYHEPWSIECIEIDGEYFVKEYHSSTTSDGKYSEADLTVMYGEYYDSLVEILYDYYTESRANTTVTYSLFKVEDIVELIK